MMPKSRMPSPGALPRAQRGVALTIVLVLIVVMLLLALASMRGTLLEQYMSTSLTDRSLSFQAAEAALREAESVAALKPSTPTAAGVACSTNDVACCTNGVCEAPIGTTPRWLDTDANWTAMSAPLSASATAALGTLTAHPRYIIEVMVDGDFAIPGASCTTSGDLSPDAACTGRENRYRITARSFANNRAEVILQSNIAVP